MTHDDKEIKRKLRILKHAEHSANIAKTSWFFGVARSLFYLWRDAYRKYAEEGLKRKRPVPKSHPRQTPPEVEDKVLYLRRQYHLGTIRVMGYMERYHVINISESTVTRSLRRHGLRRLPQRSERRAVHTRRYNKQVGIISRWMLSFSLLRLITVQGLNAINTPPLMMPLAYAP